MHAIIFLFLNLFFSSSFGWLVVLRHGFELKAIFILNLKVGLQPRQNGGPDTELRIVTLAVLVHEPSLFPLA